MKILVLCPHFEPDTAPTGTVMTRIVRELADLGHRLHVVTALPWYAHHDVEPAWRGRWWRTEHTSWGSITRVHPFPGADKSNLLRRAIGFVQLRHMIDTVVRTTTELPDILGNANREAVVQIAGHYKDLLVEFLPLTD